MAKTITLRLSEAAYDMVRRYAEDDQQSMNAWVENLLETEDMRRRCQRHDTWIRENPDAAAFSEVWADRNLDELTAQ